MPSAWSVRPVLFKNQLNRCEVRNVDDDDNDDDDDYDDESCNNFGEDSTSVAILTCLQTNLWAHLLQQQECNLKPVAHSQ